MPMKRCSYPEATHIRVKGIISMIRGKIKDDYGDKIVILNNGQRVKLTERRMELFEVEYYKYEGDGPTGPQWNDVERELILADIAYLKQKEVESGDWAKWEEDQKKWKSFNSYRENWGPALGLEYVTVEVRVGGVPQPAPNYGFVQGCQCPMCNVARRQIESQDPDVTWDAQGRPHFSDIARPLMRNSPSPPSILNGTYSLDGLRTGNIDASIYQYCVGRAPTPEELDHCNCGVEGTPGHLGCGWCSDCNKPRAICGHAKFVGG